MKTSTRAAVLQTLVIGFLTLSNCSRLEANAVPEWDWAKGFGGPAGDQAYGMAVDTNGNVYLCGQFAETIEFFGQILVSTGDRDVFVAKLTPAGNLEWVIQGTGTGGDYANGIAVDPNGDVLVTGSYGSNGGAFTIGGNTLGKAGSAQAMWLAKFNNYGGLIWTVRGTGTIVTGLAVRADAADNVFVAGTYDNGAATFSGIALGDLQDVFLAKYDPAGAIQWATRMGGSGLDGIGNSSLEIDAIGNAYVAGIFNGTARFGSSSVTSAGDFDAFLAKVGGDGIHQWVRTVSGGDYDQGRGVAVGTDGRVYFTGEFTGVAMASEVAIESAGGTDIFLAAYKPNGDLDWVQVAGGGADDVALGGIASGPDGALYLSGYSFSTDALFGTLAFASTALADGFVVRYDNSGNAQWLAHVEGEGSQQPRLVVGSPLGGVYVAGQHSLPSTFGNHSISHAGSADGFLAKLNVASAEQPVPMKAAIIRNGNDTVTVSWPAGLTNITVESKQSLSGSEWLPVPGAGANSVTVPLRPGGSEFFRLKQ